MLSAFSMHISDVLKDLSSVSSGVTLWQGGVGITDILLVTSCLELFYGIYLLTANKFKFSLEGQ